VKQARVGSRAKAERTSAAVLVLVKDEIHRKPGTIDLKLYHGASAAPGPADGL